VPRFASISLAQRSLRSLALVAWCAAASLNASSSALALSSQSSQARTAVSSKPSDAPAPLADSPSGKLTPPVRPAPEPPVLRLSDLLMRPQRHLGTRIRLDVQWDGSEPRWRPYVSRFAPAEFACMRAWADEAHLWRESAHERPFRHLYARRGGAYERLLATSPRYKRWRLELEVREVLLGQPWMEIVGAVPLPDSVGEGALIHAARADELAQQGQWEIARSNYERALAGLLPAHQRAELERLRDECTLALEALGRTR